MRADGALKHIARLLKDPPPGHLFEITEQGIAVAQLGGERPTVGFREMGPGVLNVTPMADNVANEAAFQGAVNSVAGAGGGRRRRAALILPDYCTRIAVLEFEALPHGAEEQRALVRFRMKKSVPFDIEGAALSYYSQPKAGAKGKMEVVVAVTALEILARYEAPFRAAGFQPGLVTTSLMASLNLVKPGGTAVVAKLCGRVLTVAVVEESALKLVRCVELERVAAEEVEAVVLPTLAYVEDELKGPARRVVLCGFGDRGKQWGPAWAGQWGIEVEEMASRFGPPGETNAGLLGLMESMAA